MEENKDYSLKNSNASFFYAYDDDDELKYARVAVNKIIWSNEIVCQNCGGSITKAFTCSGCDDPRAMIEQGRVESVLLGETSVELEAVLPNGVFLYNTPPRFEIHYSDCGVRDRADNWSTRIKFSVKEIYKRVIEQPVVLECVDVSRVSLKVVLKATAVMENRVSLKRALS